MHGRLRNSSPRGQSPSRPWDRYVSGSSSTSTSTLVPCGRPPTSPRGRRPRASLPSTMSLGVRSHRPQPQLPLSLLSGTTPRRRAQNSSNNSSSQPAIPHCLARRSRSLDGLLLDAPSSGEDLGSRDELDSRDELGSRDEVKSQEDLCTSTSEDATIKLTVKEPIVKAQAFPETESMPEPKAVDKLLVGECEQYLSENDNRWGEDGNFVLLKSVSCEADVDRDVESDQNDQPDYSRRLNKNWTEKENAANANEESKGGWKNPRATEDSSGSVMSLPLSATEPKRKRNFMDRCVNKVRSLIKK